MNAILAGDRAVTNAAIQPTGELSFRTVAITLAVETWVLRRGQGKRVKVTAAEFVLVAVDDARQPRKLPADE